MQFSGVGGFVSTLVSQSREFLATDITREPHACAVMATEMSIEVALLGKAFAADRADMVAGPLRSTLLRIANGGKLINTWSAVVVIAQMIIELALCAEAQLGPVA